MVSKSGSNLEARVITDKTKELAVQSVVNLFNARHLVEGISYSLTDILNHPLVRELGITDAQYPPEEWSFFRMEHDHKGKSAKKYEVIELLVEGAIIYGIKTKRDVEFIRRSLDAMKQYANPKQHDPYEINLDEIDMINKKSVAKVLESHYDELGLIKVKAGKGNVFYFKESFPHGRESITQDGSAAEARRIYGARQNLIVGGKLEIGHHLVKTTGDSPRFVYTREGAKILRNYLKSQMA